MNLKSPEAYDPELQARIAECEHDPAAYVVRLEIERYEADVAHNERMIRALEKQTENSKQMLRLLRKMEN